MVDGETKGNKPQIMTTASTKSRIIPAQNGRRNRPYGATDEAIWIYLAINYSHAEIGCRNSRQSALRRRMEMHLENLSRAFNAANRSLESWWWTTCAMSLEKRGGRA